MRTGIATAVALTFAISLSALAGDYGKDKGEGKCICGDTTTVMVIWCEHCDVGKAYGQKVKSKKLMTALSGHEVDASKVNCGGCKTALKDDTRCDHCNVAFYNGAAYKSPVSLALAKGNVVSADNIQCANCKTSLLKGKGYCTHCSKGFVAGMVYDSEDDYKSAKKASTILAKASNASRKCEGCAVAMVSDGECSGCKVAFKDGKKVKGDHKDPHAGHNH